MLTCREVMRPTTTPLYVDDPVAKAVDFVLTRHMGLVPVVDRQERFVGFLSGERLMRALLPKHLTMVRGLDRMGYLRESQEELRERLDGLEQRPIGEVMDPRAEVVHPDTPLIEAQTILAGTQFVVPVVDPDSGRLLGAISFFTILALLRGEPSWSERLENNGQAEGTGA
jgi:CBS-domain-containing membrane protein